MMHQAEKRQKISSNEILGMKIIEIAVKKAADPSIKDETLVTLPFYLMLLPISIAMTVPMMLQGPPMQLPIRNMATQYCHAMLVRAKETMNIMIELTSNNGLRNRALLLYLSTMNPTAVPPMRLPKSIMLAIQPFCDSMSPPLLPKKIGSQKSKPQMQPFKQEYPRTQRGTLGRHITEKIPYFRPGGLSYLIIEFQSICPFSCNPSVSIDSSFSFLPSFYSSGFSFKKSSMSTATATAKPPVTAKFHTHDI